MHADEVHTDAGIVRRLLSAQFPHWSELPIERVPSFGTDNALYRLGSMVVRLPRIEWATRDIEKDARWLEQLRPLVPVEIPELLARGAPGEGYPWTWGIYRWLEGENPAVGAIARPDELARDVGRFVAAVRRLGLPDTRPGSRVTRSWRGASCRRKRDSASAPRPISTRRPGCAVGAGRSAVGCSKSPTTPRRTPSSQRTAGTSCARFSVRRTYVRNILGPVQTSCKERRTLLSSPST
jgi:aminoglycoside phosphotransferase (APT) family kinase protein